MNKKIIVFSLSLIVYSIIITVLLINQREKTQTLNETIIGSEMGYLSRIEALTRENKEATDTNRLTYDGHVKFKEIDEASIAWFKQNGIDDYTKISDQLILHPELIPFDGVLGGTMHFTKAVVLNSCWVYSEFEDGHMLGYGIFKFELDKDSNITWRVVDAFLDGDERD